MIIPFLAIVIFYSSFICGMEQPPALAAQQHQLQKIVIQHLNVTEKQEVRIKELEEQVKVLISCERLRLEQAQQELQNGSLNPPANKWLQDIAQISAQRALRAAITFSCREMILKAYGKCMPARPAQNASFSRAACDYIAEASALSIGSYIATQATSNNLIQPTKNFWQIAKREIQDARNSIQLVYCLHKAHYLRNINVTKMQDVRQLMLQLSDSKSVKDVSMDDFNNKMSKAQTELKMGQTLIKTYLNLHNLSLDKLKHYIAQTTLIFTALRETETQLLELLKPLEPENNLIESNTYIDYHVNHNIPADPTDYPNLYPQFASPPEFSSAWMNIEWEPFSSYLDC